MPQSNNQFLENLFNPNTGESFEGRIDDIEVVIDTFKDDVPDDTFIKKINDTTMTGVPATNTFSNTDSNLVIRDNGLIKTNTLNVGDTDPSTNYDIQVKHSSSNSELALINSILYKPTIKFIRNSSSDQFGGDTSDDYRIRNNNGFFDFDVGNSTLTNNFQNIMSLTDGYVKINLNGDGELKDKINLIMYRQTTAPAKNTAYIELEVDSSVNGGRLQKFPNLSGTFILDSTPDYIDLNTLRTSFNGQTNGNLLIKDSTNTFSNIGIDNSFGSGSLIVQKDAGTIKSKDFLAEQAGTGYMFESFSNPAVISYLFHGTNSGLGAAVEMPTTSGQLGLTSENPWEKVGTIIQPKSLLNKLGLGPSTPAAISRLNFGSDTESKICLFDGGSGNMYGFGVSSGQLNYHVNTTSDKHVFYANGLNAGGVELMRIQGNKQIFLGQSGGDGVSGSGDVVISNRNDSNVEIEFRSDDTSLVSPQDYLIGKIQAGFTSSSYTDGYIKFQTHFVNNTTLNDLLTLKGSTATLDGTLNVSSTATFQGLSNFENTVTLQNGSPNLILRDTTDSDDIQVRFDGLYGGVNVTNARITTTSNYLNLETTNNAPMNGLILKTNLINALTIDNNQNIETTGAVGIGKAPASGFALDVDGTNPSIFRGDVTYLGQAVYNNGLDLSSGVFNNTINTDTLTANRTINFPNSDGTVALINTGGVWTTSGNDIYNSNSGNVYIGATSGSEKLEVTGNVKILSGNLQVDELQGTLGSSTKIDLNPGGGNIDLVVPNSAGGISPNVDINFKTASTIRMNLNSIDGLVFHENFIFKNTTGSTYFPLSFNGAVANSLNVGTDLLNVSSGNVAVQSGTTTSGINATIGVTKIGNGLSNYAMFSHSNNFSVGNYALLQQNDGQTFLNCASTKQINFRINNQDIGLISDTAGAEKTEFYSHASSIPEFNSSGQVVANFISVDNPVFRVHSSSGTQNNRCVMYTQVVVNASTTPFTQQPLELQDYGTQPGYVTNAPGFAFRVCDPLAQAEIYCSFSGYTTLTNALQTIKLQLYAHKTDGTKAWVDICSYDFYVNSSGQHLSHSFYKRLTFTYSYYSFARFVLTSGTFTGDTGDSFFLVISQLPRQTR
jgi:hypothetical protein